MREKPNFDKSVGSKKIYERKEYAIYKVKRGYIVHNTNKQFEDGHTHIYNYNKAKSIIDLAVRKKMPNTPKKWEIECLLRIITDKDYIKKLKELLEELK